MATYLSNDAYARFKGTMALQDLQDQFHAQLDSALTPPGGGTDLTNPLGAPSPDLAAAVPDPAPPPQPTDDAAAPSPPAAPAAASNLPAPDAPVTAPLVPPNSGPSSDNSAAAAVTPTSPVTAPLSNPASTQQPLPPAPTGGDWQSIANAQLGKPYIWGSAGGRSTFDQIGRAHV